MISKGAIYVRESTDKQDWKAQLDQCRSYCKNEEIKIFKVYKDISSGSNNNRKEFLKLQEDMEDLKFNKVIVWELSRATRDFMAYKVLLMRMEELEVELHSIQEGILTQGDIDNEFSNDIRALINSHERKRTAKRVKSRMEHIARSGRWTGGPPPYGYRLTNKHLIIYEIESLKVNEIFNFYLSGESVSSISKKFGFTDIKKVRRILRNEIYIGKLKFRQQEIKNGGIIFNKTYETIDGVHKPILNEDLFYSVQHLLEKKRRRKNPQGTYLFHRVKCYCGSSIYGTKGYKGKIYYVCSDNCGNGIIHQSDLLKWVLDELKANIHRFNCLDTIEVHSQSQKRMYKRELLNLDKSEEKLLEKYLDEKVQERIYDNQMKKYDIRRSEIKKEIKRLEKIETNKKTQESNRNLLLKYLNKIDSTNDTVTLEKVLGLIIDEIIFHDHFKFDLKVNFLD